MLTGFCYLLKNRKLFFIFTGTGGHIRIEPGSTLANVKHHVSIRLNIDFLDTALQKRPVVLIVSLEQFRRIETVGAFFRAAIAVPAVFYLLHLRLPFVR